MLRFDPFFPSPDVSTQLQPRGGRCLLGCDSSDCCCLSAKPNRQSIFELTASRSSRYGVTRKDGVKHEKDCVRSVSGLKRDFDGCFVTRAATINPSRREEN